MKRITTFNPKHTNSSVKYCVDRALDWASMSDSRTGSFIFVGIVAHYGSSGIDSEVYRNV